MGRNDTKAILLVEDEGPIAMAEAQMLRSHGYKVITAYSGEEAIKVAGEQPGIDLVLMDIGLGRGMSGIQAAEAIIQKHDLPLIFLSSHTEREVVEPTESIPSYGYVVKNAGEAVLMASIRTAFRLFEGKRNEKEKDEALREIDTIERKKAEMALLESDRKLRLIATNTSDVVLAYDMERRLLYVNPALKNLTGYTPAELWAQQFIEWVHPEDQQKIGELREGLYQGHGYSEIEFRLLTKDGQVKWISSTWGPLYDENGQQAGVQGRERDITEQKRNRALINLRLELLEFSVSNSLDEFIQKAIDKIGQFVDSPIGFFHFVEPDQKTLSIQFWSTRTRQEFCHIEAKEMHGNIDQMGGWGEVITQGKPIIHNDYPNLPRRRDHPAGHAEILRELIVPIFREGRVVSIVGVGNKPAYYDEKDVEAVAYMADITWEITKRKKTELKLQGLLVEKEMLMKELQHRTKNSLNVVTSLLALEMDLLPDERSRSIFTNAQARIRSMSAIYEQLYQENSIDRVSLNIYIQHLCRHFSSSYLPQDGKVSIETNLEEVYLDIKRALPIGIILNELVTNAIKYAFPGESSGKVVICLKQEQNRLVLQVSDNGVGIKSKAQSEKSSGFGLILVKTLVAQIQGDFSVENSSGTNVRIGFEE